MQYFDRLIKGLVPVPYVCNLEGHHQKTDATQAKMKTHKKKPGPVSVDHCQKFGLSFQEKTERFSISKENITGACSKEMLNNKTSCHDGCLFQQETQFVSCMAQMHQMQECMKQSNGVLICHQSFHNNSFYMYSDWKLCNRVAHTDFVGRHT